MNMYANLSSASVADSIAVSPLRAVRRWPIVAVMLLVLAAAAAWFMYNRAGTKAAVAAAAAAASADTAPSVSVVVPGQIAVADTVHVTGSIAARRDLPVGIQGDGGLVTDVLVDVGQSVRRGQVLARVDHAVQTQQVASMAAGIRSARADAALAQAELDRAVRLVDKGFISRADIDRKTAARDGNLAKVSLAQAQLGEMQARMARLDIRAPANGLVLTRNIEAGQVISPASPSLFRIAENGVLEMRAQVAEQDLARLKVGQPANVRPIGSKTDYPARVWLLDPVIDNASRQGIARLALAYAPGLRVGAFANATIAAGEATQPVLPQASVMVDERGSFVYLVDADGKVVRRAVEVGSVNAVGMSIASGLTGREQVVLSAGAFLQPGEKVKPVVTGAAASGATLTAGASAGAN